MREFGVAELEQKTELKAIKVRGPRSRAANNEESSWCQAGDYACEAKRRANKLGMQQKQK